MSFRYYGLGYLVVFVIIGLGFIYSFVFFAISFAKPLWRVFIFTAISYLSIIGFDWLRLDILFVDSYFGVSFWQIFIVLLCLYLFRYKKYALLLLPLAFDPHYATQIEQKRIDLVQTDIAQEIKWQPLQLQIYIDTLLSRIESAKQKGYTAVVFPESFLTTHLNTQKKLLHTLKEKSHDIAIITGALEYDNGNKNATYFFYKGKMQVAHKVVLVPFGEANPLPQFMSNIVNDIFYDGASDYEKADDFTYFEINGSLYKNAICYEATDRSLYADTPQNVIALSNNAWFKPSIEPTMQKLLLKSFVKRDGVNIYHATNGSPSYTLSRRSYALFRD